MSTMAYFKSPERLPITLSTTIGKALANAPAWIWWDYCWDLRQKEIHCTMLNSSPIFQPICGGMAVPPSFNKLLH